MKHYQLVLPEFLNDQGSLFGGHMLKFIDEYAYITVSLDYPGNRFVTVSLDNVVFRKPIKVGYILCFDIQEYKFGKSSVGYTVKVHNAKDDSQDEGVLFETKIVFVNIGEYGKKKPIQKIS